MIPISPDDDREHEQRCARFAELADEREADEDLRGEPECWDGEP